MPKKILRQGKNYISGVWFKHEEELPVINPANLDTIGRIPYSYSYVHSIVDSAVYTANQAFKAWSKWSWVKRAEVIDDLVQLVKKNAEEIARLGSMESGKILNEMRADVVEGIHMLQYCAGMGRQPIGYKLSSEIAEKESETYKRPKGVCSVITPWNFPFAIPTWLIGPALISGNTVVFKPSEETPFTAQFLVELFDQVAKKHNVPPGVLNLVHGNGEAGEAMVRHPLTVGQLFTGSREVGSKIKKIVSEHHNKFAVCEMGGKNSLIVSKSANIDLAVKAAVLSGCKTTHQRCVSADLFIVDEKVEPTFTKNLLEMIKRVRFGDPFDEKSFAGPLINKAAYNKHASTLRFLIESGSEKLLEGRMEGFRHGYFVEPSVFRMYHEPNRRALREEFFTPIMIVVPVRDFDEALYVANDHEYGLSMALISEDYREHRKFRDEGDSGLKYVNLPTIGAEIHLPFGGTRASGTGMPSAAWLFNYMCHDTAFTVNHGTNIQMAQGLSSKI